MDGGVPTVQKKNWLSNKLPAPKARLYTHHCTLYPLAGKSGDLATNDQIAELNTRQHSHIAEQVCMHVQWISLAFKFSVLRAELRLA